MVANDHGIIYFRDPVNDIRLGITTKIDPTWNDQPERAAALALRTTTRARGEGAGRNLSEALGELARSQRPGA